MLNIFKNYSAKSCLLDDFNFYEKQEKPAQTEKTDKSAPLPMDKRKERDFSVSFWWNNAQFSFPSSISAKLSLSSMCRS